VVPGAARAGFVNLRQSVRALVIDPDDRVVLVRFDFPDRVVWAAPGGGVESGEGDALTLVREVREELGLELAEPIGQHVWERTHVFPMSEWDGQVERFYLVRVPRFELRHGPQPDVGVTDLRWWTLDELDAATETMFAPRRLGVLLRALLEGELPAEPIDVGV